MIIHTNCEEQTSGKWCAVHSHRRPQLTRVHRKSWLHFTCNHVNWNMIQWGYVLCITENRFRLSNNESSACAWRRRDERYQNVMKKVHFGSGSIMVWSENFLMVLVFRWHPITTILAIYWDFGGPSEIFLPYSYWTFIILNMKIGNCQNLEQLERILQEEGHNMRRQTISNIAESLPRRCSEFVWLYIWRRLFMLLIINFNI